MPANRQWKCDVPWDHWSPIIETLVMTKLRGGTQLSQSGVGYGVSVECRSSFELDDACSITVYSNIKRLYMVMMAIYRKCKNDLSTDL